MTRRVYQFPLRAPIEGAALVRAQLRAAHEYRNDLVSIERGRRSALRAVDDVPAVREAIAVVLAATKSTRRSAIALLRDARKEARAKAADELVRIGVLDAQARRDARAITPTWWGTYLDIEAAHNQARSAPLYEPDAVTPSDPAFARGPRLGREAFAPDDARAAWWLGDGQIGVQLQKGLPTPGALAGADTRVRLVLRPADHPRDRYGTLWLRVGSEGRDPVWAQWPIKLHRAIPDSAIWKWVRVSVAREGTRERWSVEITVDDAAPRPRDLDRSLAGAIAVEWEWSLLDSGAIRVARWADTRGGSGELLLPERIATGIRKPDGIRAVRDLELNALKDSLQQALREASDVATPRPPWLADAASTLHLWRSPDRFRGLLYRWQRERYDGARSAYEMLEAACHRDDHLYDYEVGARRGALGARRDLYRCVAARWSQSYRTVLMSDQDLSREARWGPESEVRFTAGCFELRSCLRNAFGDADAIDSRWRDAPGEQEDREWCERTRDAWSAGGARGDGRFAIRKEKTTNAWAARKAKSKAKRGGDEASRDPDGKGAE